MTVAVLAVALMLSACGTSPPVGGGLRATETVWCADGDGVLETITWAGHDGPLTGIDVRVLELSEGPVSDDDLAAACAGRWRWTGRHTLCEAYATPEAVAWHAERPGVTAVHGAPTTDRPGFPVILRGHVDCTDLTLQTDPAAEPFEAAADPYDLPSQLRAWRTADALNDARRIERRLRTAASGGCLDLDEARTLGLTARDEMAGDWPVIETAAGAADPEHAGLCFDVRLHRAGFVEVTYHAGPTTPIADVVEPG